MENNDNTRLDKFVKELLEQRKGVPSHLGLEWENMDIEIPSPGNSDSENSAEKEIDEFTNLETANITINGTEEKRKKRRWFLLIYFIGAFIILGILYSQFNVKNFTKNPTENNNSTLNNIDLSYKIESPAAQDLNIDQTNKKETNKQLAELKGNSYELENETKNNVKQSLQKQKISQQRNIKQLNSKLDFGQQVYEKQKHQSQQNFIKSLSDNNKDIESKLKLDIQESHPLSSNIQKGEIATQNSSKEEHLTSQNKNMNSADEHAFKQNIENSGRINSTSSLTSKKIDLLDLNFPKTIIYLENQEALLADMKAKKNQLTMYVGTNLINLKSAKGTNEDLNLKSQLGKRVAVEYSRKLNTNLLLNIGFHYDQYHTSFEHSREISRERIIGTRYEEIICEHIYKNNFTDYLGLSIGAAKVHHFNSKFSIELNGAISANTLTFIDVTSLNQGEVTRITEIKNVPRIALSGNLGVGINYSISDIFSVGSKYAFNYNFGNGLYINEDVIVQSSHNLLIGVNYNF